MLRIRIKGTVEPLKKPDATGGEQIVDEEAEPGRQALCSCPESDCGPLPNGAPLANDPVIHWPTARGKGLGM
jgi:hypothetical protein